MSDDEKPSEQAEADASPHVEPDHAEGAPNAYNPPLTSSPNDLFLQEKSKHELRVEKLNL
jgi:hypothetical protein